MTRYSLAYLKKALAILDRWDDEITSHGGDDSRDMAKIRRLKLHIRKAIRERP